MRQTSCNVVSGITDILPVRNSIGIFPEWRLGRDALQEEIQVKEERNCALAANQQTIQVHMDRQGKDRQDNNFQALASEGFDPFSLWERVNRDMDLLRDLVELFAEEYPELLLSIKGAIEKGSSVDVQRLSHKLKGSALQFSGSLVVAAAGTLEEMGRAGSLHGADKVLETLSLEVLRLVEALKMMVGSEKPVM